MWRTITICILAIICAKLTLIGFDALNPRYTPEGDEWCYYDQFSTFEQMHWHVGDINKMIVVIPNGGVEVYLRCD